MGFSMHRTFLVPPFRSNNSTGDTRGEAEEAKKLKNTHTNPEGRGARNGREMVKNFLMIEINYYTS